MNQYIKVNRAESFSPIFKEFKQVLMPDFEIDNLLSQLLISNKKRTLHCNSLFAENTINVIIDYFNEQSRLDTDFTNNILNEITSIPFAFNTDNNKLKQNIELNAETSFITSANGMKNILNAFIKYSDFETNSTINYFEDIDYAIEPINEDYNSSKEWVLQTIDEPWYK